MASLSRFIAGRRMSSSQVPRKPFRWERLPPHLPSEGDPPPSRDQILADRFAACLKLKVELAASTAATDYFRDLASLLAAGWLRDSIRVAKSLLGIDHPSVGSVPDLYHALAAGAAPDPQPAFLRNAASALVSASALVGHPDGGLRLVSVLASSRAPLPSPTACGHLLRSLVSLRRYADASRAFEILTASGARLRTFAWNNAVEACVMTGDVDEAVRMLRRMGLDDDDAPHPDTYSYNMVIRGLWRAGRGDDAMKMLDEMADRAVARDDFTYNTMVLGHCMSRDLEAARKLQDHMLQEGLKPNYTITNSAMLLELFRHRRMGEIAALLDEKMTQGMVLDEVFTRGVLLKVLARMDADSLLRLYEKHEKTGGIMLSVDLFKRMDEDSLLRLFEKSIKMSARTQKFMLLNLHALGMDWAEKVLNKLVEGSVQVSEYDSDSGEPSRKISLDSRERAAVSRMCCSLIEKFCRSGELQRALSMFHQMKSHQIDAARSTCDAIIRSLCRMGGIPDARDLEKEMEKHGLSQYDDIQMERSKLGMLRGDRIFWFKVYSWNWDGATH